MPKVWKYGIGDEVIVNEKAKNGMPFTIGRKGSISFLIENGLYDYEVKFDVSSSGKFKEEELDEYFEGMSVLQNEIGYFEEQGLNLGKLVDKKQAAYGDSIKKTSQLMKVFMQDYEHGDTYVIPKELLDHILLQVRIIDKQNRIFSNPKADLMDESPYSDLSGYGLLGQRMQEGMKNN